MADAKISALPASTTPLAGTEVLPVVQSSTTKQVSVANLTAGRAVSSLSQTITDGTRSLYLRSRSTAAGTGLAVGTEIASAGNVVSLAGDIDGGGTGGGVNGALYASDAGVWYRSFYYRNTASSPNATLYLMPDIGNVNFGAGNLIQGTAAKGINFTANTPAAGMTSQLLNWYETGTFTPTITSQAGTITTYTASGYYTRIGNSVTVQLYLYFANIGTASGYAQATLPFSVTNLCTGVGRESAIVGFIVMGQNSGNDLRMWDGRTANGNFFSGGNGTEVSFTATYLTS